LEGKRPWIALRTDKNGPSNVRPLKVTKRSNFERAAQKSESISFSEHPTKSKSPSADFASCRSAASYQTAPLPVSGFSIATTTIFPIYGESDPPAFLLRKSSWSSA
jgi:hypothetical protein